MKKSLLIILLFGIGCISTWAQNYQWAENLGSNNKPQVAVNGETALYFGTYSTSFVIGGQTVPANGANTSSYLAKADQNKNYSWVKAFHSQGVQITDAKTDGIGNIVVCGVYQKNLIIGSTFFNNPAPDY